MYTCPLTLFKSPFNFSNPFIFLETISTCCLALPCLVLYCPSLVLSCLVLSCLVLSCLVLSCPSRLVRLVLYRTVPYRTLPTLAESSQALLHRSVQALRSSKPEVQVPQPALDVLAVAALLAPAGSMLDDLPMPRQPYIAKRRHRGSTLFAEGGGGFDWWGFRAGFRSQFDWGEGG